MTPGECSARPHRSEHWPERGPSWLAYAASSERCSDGTSAAACRLNRRSLAETQAQSNARSAVARWRAARWRAARWRAARWRAARCTFTNAAALDAALPEWTCRPLQKTMRECAKPDGRDSARLLDEAARARRPFVRSTNAAESTPENATRARVKSLAT